MTEEYKQPWPNTEEEFLSYMRQELAGPFDYNTSADALWKVALAAFNYAAHVVGATGFQASHADMMFISKTRGLKGPFAIIDGDELLYPQYNTFVRTSDMLEKWQHTWANKEARKRLEEYEANPVLTSPYFCGNKDSHEPHKVSDGWGECPGEYETVPSVHPNVVAHWKWLASLEDWKDD